MNLIEQINATNAARESAAESRAREIIGCIVAAQDQIANLQAKIKTLRTDLAAVNFTPISALEILGDVKP